MTEKLRNLCTKTEGYILSCTNTEAAINSNDFFKYFCDLFNKEVRKVRVSETIL